MFEHFEPNTHNQKYCSATCKRNRENQVRRRQLAQDVAQAVAPAYFNQTAEDELGEASYLEYLQKSNRRLTLEAERQKHNSRQAYAAVYDAAYTALTEIQIPQIKPPRTSSVSKKKKKK